MIKNKSEYVTLAMIEIAANNPTEARKQARLAYDQAKIISPAKLGNAHDGLLSVHLST